MRILSSMARIWLTRSFRPFRFTSDYDSKLSYMEAGNLGLYIHIPFCRSLCDFCPYCKTVYREDSAKAYVEALKKEIALVGSASPERKQVTTLYFGGGTPALVAHEIQGIMETVRRYFDITEGVGLELHPADVTVHKLRMLKEAGVTRISIGVQSFGEACLKLLGRQGHVYSTMFDALSKVPFETVAMDFIFALPGQTAASLQADIETAFANGANHVALYPFIDFTMNRRDFNTMSEAGKRLLMDQMEAYRLEKGYVRDSIWTFGKPGAKKYSSMTRDNFLGFGCSATTLLEDQFKINTFSIPEYTDRVNSGTIPTALTLRFTRRQRMVYYLFWTAYTTEVDAQAFRQFFGVSLERYYGFELLLARMLGLVRKDNHRYVLTSKGMYYFHYYEYDYTLSYIDQMWNLMGTQAFPGELVIK